MKKLVLCVAVWLCGQAVWDNIVEAKSTSIFDFFKSSGPSPEEESDKNISQDKKDSIKNRFGGFAVTEHSTVDVNTEATTATEESSKDSLAPIKPQIVINEEDRIDEVFVNSFRGVTNLSDLLYNIKSNVENLAYGRMSNDDYNKLVQMKQKITESIVKYFSVTGAYDKISYLERVLMDYNIVGEISVHFLSDIDKQDINNVQNALFVSEVNSLSNELTYAFSTPIGDNLKDIVININTKIPEYDISKFQNKLLQEIKKIPVELLEADQYNTVTEVSEKLQNPITGTVEVKCNILKQLVNAYNELKSIPFRLKKISAESMRNLVVKAVEDVFFEKMLDALRVMDAEQFTDLSENDVEVLAARNIKKSICKLLGGSFYGSVEYKSNIEQFRTSESLEQKEMLLKDSITQFNKTVELFKNAVTALKASGRHIKIKNINEIQAINEDVDKIFEKIAIYDKSMSNQPVQGSDVINVTLPNKDLKSKIVSVSDSTETAMSDESVKGTEEVTPESETAQVTEDKNLVAKPDVESASITDSQETLVNEDLSDIGSQEEIQVEEASAKPVDQINKNKIKNAPAVNIEPVPLQYTDGMFDEVKPAVAPSA